jgi:hypothetical protein
LRERLWPESRDVHQVDQTSRQASAFLFVAPNPVSGDVLSDHLAQVFADAENIVVSTP